MASSYMKGFGLMAIIMYVNIRFGVAYYVLRDFLVQSKWPL